MCYNATYMAARNTRKKTTRSVSRTPDLEVQTSSLFDDLSPHTKQAIGAVAFSVLGVIMILAAFKRAGLIGEYLMIALTWLFGYGYVVAPLVCFSYALVFLRPRDDDTVSVSKIVGVALLFFMTLTGIHLYVSPNSFVFSEISTAGGALGYMIGYPLIILFGDIASALVAGSLALAGLFLTLNTGFGIPGFMRRTRETENIDDGTDELLFSDDELESVEESIRKTERSKGRNDTADELAHEDEEVVPAKPKTGMRILKPSTNEQALTDESGIQIANSFFSGPYTPPPIALLKKDRGRAQVGDVKANANIIKRTLKNFRIHVEMDEVSIGPSVTRYAIKPAEGVRIQKIVGLQNNLELALAASPVRIEAPIPGKSLVGIEVPNATKATVGLASLLASPEYLDSNKPLMVALGRDISGHPHFANVAKMPHTLIAGTTGSGKSVTIHALITSLLFRNPPDLLRFIMVDPKRVELTLYNGIPHLLTPVIIDPKKAIISLKWAINEMTRRYDILQSHKVRDISSYHDTIYKKAKEQWVKDGENEVDRDMLPEPLPYIVIVIDELADLMSTYPRELESSIVRLAQMSRAVGIHLVLSTQRPSVNVVTGLIKANIPSRIALQVASQVDSKTIIDQAGAEKLLGQGDMLFLSGELSKPCRLQSAYLSEEEVKKVVSHLKKQSESYSLDSINLGDAEENGSDAIFSSGSFDEGADDDLYDDARIAVLEAGKASTSYLQRKLSIGYGRAAKLVDMLEERGIVGPANGSKPREVIKPE